MQFEFNYSIILCKINFGEKKCFVSPFMLSIVARKYNFNTVTCNYVKYDNGLSSWSFHQLLFVVSASSFTIVEIIQWYFNKKKNEKNTVLPAVAHCESQRLACGSCRRWAGALLLTCCRWRLGPSAAACDS